MAFEGLKEQLRDNWADLSSKIQENSTFNNLREKFESQSPTIQKAIIGGACALVALFLISFPWGYISDSQDHMTQFGENRGLIQGLLRASRTAKEPSPLPPPMSADALRSRVDAVLKDNRLVPDQIGEIVALPERPAKDLVPAVVVQTGIVVQIKKLNLDQILNLNHQFQTLGAGIKLVGVDIVQNNGQTHYYDMNARIVSFALPNMTTLEPEAPAETGGKKKAAKRPRKADEETPE